MLLLLISHCNSSLQALLPETSTQVCHLSPHCSPDDQVAADNAADKAAESAAAPLAAAPACSGIAQAGAQTGSEAAEAAEAATDGATQLVHGLVLEGPVGQALAEATVEMVLAVLRGSEDSGQDLQGTCYTFLHMTFLTLHAMHGA